ncbi:MAG: hypothetical protein JWO81_1792 [Alphaproteobacteria bacterium]|nr:hypothetical protein [Alphaproteobacteria bacterium]
MKTNSEISKGCVEKREWIRPEMQRLLAGAAESQKASVPDGGGGFQAS